MQFSTINQDLEGIGNNPLDLNKGMQLAAWQEHKKHCSITGLRPDQLQAIEEQGLGKRASAMKMVMAEKNTAVTQLLPNRFEEEIALQQTRAPQAVDIRYVCMCQTNIMVKLNGGHVQVEEGQDFDAKEAAEGNTTSYQGNWSIGGSSYQNTVQSDYTTEDIRGGYK